MRKILLLIGILILGLETSVFAAALDAPHNQTNAIVCADCHNFGTSPVDDACLSCHINDTGAGYSKTKAPKMLTHSSANTSAKYGTWTKLCKDCHEPHTQQQREIYGNATYLVTGSITKQTTNSPAAGFTTYNYTSVNAINPDWANPAKWNHKSANASAGNERGLILFPNTADFSKSAEIVSATATTITVTGYPGTVSASVTAPKTFAIVYGQHMSTSIGLGTARFYTNTGKNSFAYDESGTHTDPTPDGVCQVCHTQTQHWKADGTLAGVGVHAGQNGSNCVICHPHEEGFKAKGCNTCHGYPPINNSLGGTDGLAVNEGGTGSTSPGAHAKHALGLNYSCDTCHSGGMPASPIYDKVIQIGFNAANALGMYDGRLSLANGYTYSANVTNGGSQSCTTMYCHSNGKVGTSVQQYATPAWTGAPLGCTSCHGYPPQYTNGGAGTATANSHVPHVTNNDFGCQLCHNKTTTDGTTIADPKVHANATINVAFDATNPGGSYATTTKTCSTTVCHGSGAPQWGGSVKCQDCHLGAADIDDFTGTFYNNNITATIKTSEWNATGHGATGAYTSGNPAAGFIAADACLYCHDDTIAHKTAANPFRLKSFTNAVWGKNGNCQSCHATGSAGVTVNALLKNGSKKISSTHYDTKHSAGSGGQFCWDCHDPHGDNNIFMVHASVAKTSNVTTGAPTATVATTFTAFATGTDYANSAAPFTGICNVCHTITNHYTSSSGDGHNSGSRCTGCHAHSGDTINNAFKPSGCDGCHGNPPIVATLGGPNGLVDMPAITGATSAGAHSKHATSGAGAYGFSCEKCHAGGMPVSPVPDMKIQMGFNISAAFQTGTYDARTLPLPNGYSYLPGNPGTIITNNGTQTCTNIYCHSNGKGEYATTVEWIDGSLTCTACHGFPPSYATANSHESHGFGCQVCHIKTVSSDGSVIDVKFHDNASIDVSFDASNPNGTYTAATKTCSSTTCHGTGTPQWGASLSADCTACHGGNATSATPITSPSHPDHMNNASVLGTNFECAQCHNATVSPGNDRLVTGTVHANGTKNVSFLLGGTFANNQCSSTYCHSDGKASPSYATVTWGVTGTGTCILCHGGPGGTNGGANTALSSAHTLHTGSGANQFSYTCNACHSTVAGSNTTLIQNTTLHSNKTINVSMASGFGGSGSSYSSNSCSTTYCHGTKSATWTSTTGVKGNCSFCHGMSNSATDGRDTNGDTAATDPQVGAHVVHLNGSSNYSAPIACSECHTVPAGATYAERVKAVGHIDSALPAEVPMNGPLARKDSAVPTYSAGTCSTTYCHGSTMGSNQGTGTSPVWSNTAYLSGTPSLAGDCSKCHLSPPVTPPHTATMTIAQCAGCHSHFNANGTLNDKTLHVDGTVQAAGCTACHGQPPVDSTTVVQTLLTGHTAGTHARHWVLFSSQGCTICHSGGGTADSGHMSAKQITIGFTYGLSLGTFNTTLYSNGYLAASGAAGTVVSNNQAAITCNNIYCHSSGQSANGTSATPVFAATPPTWTGTATCGSCHATTTLATGSHTAHLASSTNCGNCHTGATATTYTSSNHVNKLIDVAVGYTAGGAPGNGYGTCSAATCHDNGMGVPVATPTWGTDAPACSACHAAAPATGSHTKHLSGISSMFAANAVCGNCHDGAVQGGPANPDHLDGNIDVYDVTSGDLGYPQNKVKGSAYASCTASYCHSNSKGAFASPTWGGTSTGCNFCHGFPPATTMHAGQTATTCVNCHTHVNASGSGFTDPSKHGNGTVEGGDCIGCHSVQQGKRAAVVGQFSSNSHHIQGVTLTNAHCYQCHWEANSDGSMTAYHGGPSAPGSPVNLVIYGAGSRPTAYTVGTTAVEYKAGAGSTTTTSSSPIGVVNAWAKLTTSGSGSSRTASFTAGAGTAGNRMVIIGIGWEHSTSSGCDPSAITGTYGGKTITTINEANTSNNMVGQWMGYVREADIASRTNNTITLTFSGCTPDRTPTMSVATYQGVDQSSAPTTVKASGTTGSAFAWSGLAVVKNGYSMYNVTADGITSFTPPSGYTERYDAATTNFRMTGGDKAITVDGTESRTVTGNTSSSRWALVAVSVKPAVVSSTVDASRAEMLKINQHCLGCHDADSATAQPFGDGKTPEKYAWDSTSVAERYSQTGTTPWGKYSGANVTPKNTQTKAFSAHGNASANQRGWNTSETWPNTSSTVNVLCYDCHNSHGSSVTGTTTSYTSTTANGGILKDTTTGQGGYTMTYKPAAGGSATNHNTYNAGAGLCFDCHMTPTGGTTMPWGYQGTFGATQIIMGYFDTQYFGTGTNGPQQRFPFKVSAGQNKGGHFGASASLTTPANGTISGLCTPCHDPHGVSTTLGANQVYGVPLLKGTWMTSPYKEDAAPLATNVSVGGGEEGGGYKGASKPGYNIDQNTFNTTWNWSSTTRITQTDAQFAGLCLKCHSKTSINPTTTGSTWKSMDRIHNTVKGWGGSGANANNAVHSFTCSKCHAPHNSALNRLMVTNCLDYKHRGQKTSGGTPGKSSGHGEEGSGSGQFPAGGAGNGHTYYFGARPCHDNTSSTSWPTNQLWNTKTPW